MQLLMAGLMVAPPPGPPPTGLLEKPSVPKAAQSKAGRQGLPKNLETQEIVLEPAEVTAAPEQWKKIGEEITEELDYTPARFVLGLYIWPDYVPLPRPHLPVAARSSSS